MTAPNNTTRRHPRTLHGSDAAYPNDPQYANPITHVGTSPRARIRDAAWWLVGVALVLALAGAALLAEGGVP